MKFRDTKLLAQGFKPICTESKKNQWPGNTHFSSPLRGSVNLFPDPVFIIGEHGLLFQTKLSGDG